MIGRTFGRYRIVAPLGEGGMGSVWRAEDPMLGREVALKLLSAALVASDIARQRFLREARAASKLHHPAIASVHDAGETDGLAWIAYELVDGESVAVRCGRGPLPLGESVALAADIAAALDHAHARGVLHRDVTAGNIMVTRDGRGVLVDFGLALPDRGAHLTTTGAMLGTSGYVAPEVLRGQPADERSDLYGLGVVLYRMVTGRLPHEGETPEAVMYRVLNESPPAPSELRPELSGELERVMLRLLAREPADRYTTAAELVEALRAVAPERSPSRGVRARRAISKRLRAATQALRRVGRQRIGVAALAGLVLFGAVAWLAAARGWLPGTAKGPPVIAVLPFQNTSVDPEEVAYLGEGLGDELVLKLGQASGYRVLPWATTRHLVDSKKSLPSIARELHADAVLVGTYRADEERVRVTASLVDGRSGIQRWSQSFDQLLTDLMTVQSNIATGVASELKGRLAPAEQQALAARPSSNPEAYEYYLRGAGFLHSPDFQTRSLAKPYFEKAIELDASLAEAYVGHGAALLDNIFRGTGGGIEEIQAADRDFRRALALRPGFARAERGLVSVAYEMGHTEEMLRIASVASTRGDSDVEGLLTRGRACVQSGLADQAVPILDRVLTLDPASQEAAWFRVVALEWSDKHAHAIEGGKQFIRQFGEDPEIYTWMGVASEMLGARSEAGLYLDRALELFGEQSSDLYVINLATSIYSRHGEAGRADQLVRRWIPILRARLVLGPDNYRVLGVLTGLEGLAGDTLNMDRHLDLYLALLARSADANAGGLMFAWRGVAASGDLARLDRAVEALQGRDLATMHPDLHAWAELLLGRPASTLFQSPVYQVLLDRVRQRVEELRIRYGPAVGLHERGSRGRS
jgi:TolB-like protein